MIALIQQICPKCVFCVVLMHVVSPGLAICHDFWASTQKELGAAPSSYQLWREKAACDS